MNNKQIKSFQNAEYEVFSNDFKLFSNSKLMKESLVYIFINIAQFY